MTADPLLTDLSLEVRPAYGRESLGEVLPSVLAALGVASSTDALGLGAGLSGVRAVAVLLVDGLGYHQLDAAAAVAPALADLTGAARSITAGFPSSTPISLTSLGTGTVPGEHGVLGSLVRVPGTAHVLNHLRWSGPDPRVWQPRPTQFDHAVAAGLAATVVSKAEFAGAGLTEAAFRGGRYLPADGVDALAAGVIDSLGTDGGLVYGYFGDIDRAGHEFGVASPQWRAAVSTLDTLLTRLLEDLPVDTALVITADHGQFDAPADRRTDLDADERLAEGVELVCGEPRVRYVYTRPGATADVIATWQGVLGPGAWVASRDEAVADGWFGPVAPDHLARIGDVVVACRDDVSITASRTDPPSFATLVAMHGSVTAAEMMVPLIVARA